MTDSNRNGQMTDPWWVREGEDLTSCLYSVVRGLRDSDSLRRSLYRVWEGLYAGDGLRGLGDLAVGALNVALGDSQFNYAARALDYVHAKLTAETPVAKADGFGADHDQYLRAQSLSRFIRGASDMLDLETQLPRAMHTALRVGTGAVFSDFRDGRPVLELVHPRELLVDPDDARHGDPRVLYRVRPTDRRAVLSRYPDSYDAIMAAGPTDSLGDDAWGSSNGASTDSIDLISAWVLPSAGEPGLHVECVSTGRPLFVEEWTLDRFPVSILRAWVPAEGGDHLWDCGYWGHGLMERLDSPQFTIDELVTHVNESIRHSKLRVFVYDDSEVTEADITDPAIGTVVRVVGGTRPPDFSNPPVIGPEVMGVIAEWRSSLYQLAGMDESVASSQRPAGVDSGIAMRTYHDFQSQTYVDHMKRYGSLVVDVIERLIDVVSMRAKADPEVARDWKVRYSHGAAPADVIRWEDVDMDRDSFVIGLEQASPVADSRAGRMQEIEEDAAAGRIPQEYLTRLREDPDRWWEERCNAREDVDFIDHTVWVLLDPNREMPVLMDEMNATMAIDRLRREVLSAVRMGRPQAVIDRLQAFMGQIVDSVQAQQQAAAAMQQAQGPSPQQQTPGAPSMGQPPAPPADFGTVPG